MHDEYLCTVAFLFGHVVYDPLPSMGYRLHSANVTQSNSLRKKLKLWKSIWFDRKDYALDKRAAMLLTFEVAEEYRKDLEDLRDYKRGLKRWRLAGSYRCENYRIERSFKTRMLLGIV